MQSFWHFALTIAVVISFNAPLTSPAGVQTVVAAGQDCSAIAMQGNGQTHQGNGTSLLQAEADAISKCRAKAVHPDTCLIVDAHCSATPKPETTNDQRWIEGLRQTKIPVNSLIHLPWIWHIVRQTTLATPAKVGLGVGVPAIQAILAYVLGGDGEIGLLEVPIFALPLGLGEFVASFGFKKRSAPASK